MADFMMMKTLLIFGLAAGNMAVDVTDSSKAPKVQTIRFSNLESGFAKVQGFLIPKGIDSDDGFPSYEFRSTINGVPVQDKDFIDCHCLIIYRYETPTSEEKKPVLLCRGSTEMKGSKRPEMVTFLFAAESLNLDPKIKGINLSLGTTTWKNVIATHASAATAVPNAERTEEV